MAQNINTYDDVIAYVRQNASDETHVEKLLESLSRQDLRQIYENDSWILEEDRIITGDLKELVLIRIRQLLHEDMNCFYDKNTVVVGFSRPPSHSIHRMKKSA